MRRIPQHRTRCRTGGCVLCIVNLIVDGYDTAICNFYGTGIATIAVRRVISEYDVLCRIPGLAVLANHRVHPPRSIAFAKDEKHSSIAELDEIGGMLAVGGDLSRSRPSLALVQIESGSELLNRLFHSPLCGEIQTVLDVELSVARICRDGVTKFLL